MWIFQPAMLVYQRIPQMVSNIVYVHPYLVKWVQFDYIILFKWVGSTTTNYPGLGEDSRWSSLRASSGPRWRWSVIRTVDGNQKSRRENQLRLVNTLPETNSSHLKMDGWINYLPFGFGPIFRCELLVAGRISHYIQGFIHVMWLFGISEPSTVCIYLNTLPATNSQSSWNWMGGRLLSYCGGLFSGANC